MKTLQSLSKTQNKFALFFKLSVIISLTSVTACATKSAANYEPCSMADSAKPLTGAQFDAAFAACKQQAENGDAISQKNLAYIYYFGNANVQQDVAESIKWFNLAAGQGNLMAMSRVNALQKGTALSYNFNLQ